jgi:DNA processing protein
MQTSWRGRAARALRASGTIRDEALVAAQIRTLSEAGGDVWFPDDPDFPAELREIPDPPDVLFTRGLRRRLDPPRVAIVGTRAASPGGLEIAFSLAADLAAAGIAIVSGLARGIDAAAHRGALHAGGSTIAVLGTGVERCFPPEVEDLFHGIAAEGLLLSEFPPHSAARRFHFPRRNRIVSGLSRAVIVVEAGERSGALLTADWALTQGKDVFAVPGDIREPRARGTNRLLKDGAHVLTGPSDVLDLLFGPDVLFAPLRRAGAGRNAAEDGAEAEIDAGAADDADDPARGTEDLLERRIARVLTHAPLAP